MAAWWSGTDELVHWGTPARMDRTDRRLLGREHESEQIDALLGAPQGPQLVLVRGEPGVGRSAFLHATGERLAAQGTAVHTVSCVSGDGERPLLLVLRLVMALEKRPSGPKKQQSAQGPGARALLAVDQRDQAAMEALLRTALTRGAPVTVLVDDVQHADPDSLDVLSRMEWSRGAPGVRLVLSAARHVVLGGAGAVDRLDGVEARTIVLSPLATHDITALAARWLRAEPDAALAGRTAELTCGVPGAADALLTGWTRRGDIRIADGHAFLGVRAQVPVLPDDDRFVAALERLGGPARAVAAALSVLGPLGPVALELTAVRTGLSPAAVGDAVRGLVEAGIVDELPGPDGTAAGGWAFRLPLTAHTVRERLSPVERSRLSALAVEALWADADADAARAGQELHPADALRDAAETQIYLADRIADAGSLVDCERAVAELTTTAERVRPDPYGRGMLRWCRAAAHLAEQPAARHLALQRYAKAAYTVGDYQTGRTIAETLLRSPGEHLTPLELQEAACLLVAVVSNAMDWPRLSRLATARWWDELPIPALAKVTGQALALCRLARWQEVLELLSRSKPVWDTSPRARAVPTTFSAVAELMLGRPEPFRRELAMPAAPQRPGGQVYALAVTLFDELVADCDPDAAQALLDSLGLTAQVLPPPSRFLWLHLTGRWDQALQMARWLLANGDLPAPTSDTSLLPSRTSAILLARGRTTSALRVLESTRAPEQGPPQCSMNAAEAEVLRTLGDLDGAEKTLRRGLDTARAHAHVYGTEELWALLAEVTAEAGRTAEAVTCLEHTGRIAARTGSGRARLRYLLASARVLRQDAPDTARDHLREAVELARTRGLPFETAATLLTAATAGAIPATLLHEAYDLFGTTGAALWRHHTRTALREAGLTVPDRKRTTAENDHLLATLIAEGLTNHQIAGVLRINEDAVAQRLSRLFSRTGLRSRTEVVTAVLTGSF